jgi:membrane protein implicated in regulation of membrane protease activity
MSGGQIAALVFAILLLLPGGCFLLFGIGFTADSGLAGALWLLIAALILGAAGLLFWVAFRQRRGGTPPGAANS